jgi:hypothetical protein
MEKLFGNVNGPLGPFALRFVELAMVVCSSDVNLRVSPLNISPLETEDFSHSQTTNRSGTNDEAIPNVVDLTDDRLDLVEGRHLRFLFNSVRSVLDVRDGIDGGIAPMGAGGVGHDRPQGDQNLSGSVGEHPRVNQLRDESLDQGKSHVVGFDASKEWVEMVDDMAPVLMKGEIPHRGFFSFEPFGGHFLKRGDLRRPSESSPFDGVLNLPHSFLGRFG